MISRGTNIIVVILFLLFISSCRVYKANILFKTEVEYIVDSIRKVNERASDNFTIAPNDYITIKVYTNKGERIIDPDFELLKASGGTNQQVQQQDIRYLVRQNGKVYLPMVGDVFLANYTIRQADSILSAEYSKYYYDVFVTSRIVNKRVVVMGAIGSKVIPLENDNISIIEAIALYGGVNNDSRASNIRLIRGDLKKPDVSIINLSTIEGMKKATLNVEPNDIIYIEPVRRVFPQVIQDIAPIVSIISSILFLAISIYTLRRT